MTPPRITFHGPLLTTLSMTAWIVGLANGDARAQVPDGTAIVCTQTSRSPAYIPGTPGLFLASLQGGPVTRVLGLPPELATDGLGAYGQGCHSVSVRSADDAILVTTTSSQQAPTAGSVYLFVLHLNGATVIPGSTQQIWLGTATTRGHSTHLQMPDGKILVAAGQNSGALSTGPMAGSLLAIVDPWATPPSITPLANPIVTGTGHVGGGALDPTGKFLYFVHSPGLPGQVPFGDSILYRYDLANGTTCPMHTLTGEAAFGLRCDDDGTIYVGATNTPAMTYRVFAIRPDGCSPSVVSSVASSLRLVAAGLDFDREAGRFVISCCGAQPWTPTNFLGSHLDSLALMDPATGSSRVFAKPPRGGWGTMSPQGVAVVNHAIESYGTANGAPGQQNHYWFENFPNPGGQPLVGNMGFSLTMASAPNWPTAPSHLLSMLLLSPRRGSTFMLGVEILVDLTSASSVIVPSGSTVPYPISIPNTPALRGMVLDAQSLHFEQNGGVASSAGLEFTIR